MFNLLLNDRNISREFNSVWARIDNYQIYSLIIDDCHYDTSLTTHQNGEFYASVPGYLSRYQISDAYPYDYEIDPFAPPYIFYDVQSGPYTDVATPYTQSEGGNAIPFYPGDALRTTPRCVSYQSFSPLGKINFNFEEIAKAYPAKNSKIRIWWSSIGRIEGWAADPHPSYQNLWAGFMADQRVRPALIKCVATSTRRVKWGYYRRNPNEDHPNVVASLDWHQGTIDIIKGDGYVLPIVDPVLGTLLVDEITKGELLVSPALPGNYPHIYLFTDGLPGLMVYWESLRTRLEPPANPGVSHAYASTFYVGRINHPGGDYPARGRGYNLRAADGTTAQQSTRFYPQPTSDPNEAIPSPSNIISMVSTVTPAAPVTRIIAANNDRWDHGTVTISKNIPPDDHPVFSVNEYQLFEAPKTDESTDESLGFGSLTMDSPRILEIHAALDAAKYAVNELDPDVPRVTTLGYWIEKTGNLLGHRPNALGEINHDLEKAKYARQRLTNPQWGKSQYSLNQFGKRGLVIPHLPNTYTKSGKLQKLYDVVYDIPQLIQALHDQVDIAQGVQHASQIRVKLADGSVQGFPDLLALQIETLKIASSMRDSVTRTQISSLVTGAEVRELFGAIGTPVAQKYLTFKDSVAKKSLQVPYFGHQQGKESVTGGISTLKINQAIALGVLMPKVQPTKTKLNPFNVLKKKA